MKQAETLPKCESSLNCYFSTTQLFRASNFCQWPSRQCSGWGPPAELTVSVRHDQIAPREICKLSDARSSASFCGSLPFGDSQSPGRPWNLSFWRWEILEGQSQHCVFWLLLPFVSAHTRWHAPSRICARTSPQQATLGGSVAAGYPTAPSAAHQRR